MLAFFQILQRVWLNDLCVDTRRFEPWLPWEVRLLKFIIIIIIIIIIIRDGSPQAKTVI